MGKNKAKKMAQEFTGTFQELKDLVNNTRGKRPMSKVNKSLTLDQALSIFDGWLDKKDMEGQPKTMKYSSSKGYMILSGDGLAVMNILRECA